jgi:hypothetical protein
VLKDLFQSLRLQCLGHLERSASIETAIGAEHVAMGVEVQEIAEGLDRNDCPGSSLLFWREAKEKDLQGIPGTAAQLGEKFSIIKKVTPEDFGQAEGEVAMGNGLENFLTEPFAKFHHTLLMAGGAEVPAFAREGQEILVATVLALDAGETIVEDAAIKIAVDHLLHIRAEETVLGGKALVIDLLKFLKMILNAPVIRGILRFTRAVCGRNIRHALNASWLTGGGGFLGCVCPGTRSSEP